MVGCHANGVHRRVGPVGLRTGYLIGVGLENAVLIGPEVQVLACWPAFKADAALQQFVLDHTGLLAVEPRWCLWIRLLTGFGDGSCRLWQCIQSRAAPG